MTSGRGGGREGGGGGGGSSLRLGGMLTSRGASRSRFSRFVAGGGVDEDSLTKDTVN